MVVRVGGAKLVPLLLLLAFPALSYSQVAVPPPPAAELSVEQIRDFLLTGGAAAGGADARRAARSSVAAGRAALEVRVPVMCRP